MTPAHALDSDAGAAASHAVVQDRVALVGVCADQVLQKRDRFLRRMQAPLRVILQDVLGVVLEVRRVLIKQGVHFINPVTVRQLPFSALGVFDDFQPLRVVCGRLHGRPSQLAPVLSADVLEISPEAARGSLQLRPIFCARYRKLLPVSEIVA